MGETRLKPCKVSKCLVNVDKMISSYRGFIVILHPEKPASDRAKYYFFNAEITQYCHNRSR